MYKKSNQSAEETNKLLVSIIGHKINLHKKLSLLNESDLPMSEKDVEMLELLNEDKDVIKFYEGLQKHNGGREK